MFRFIFIILILSSSLFLGVQLAKEPGYVLLSYATYTLEMPLWFLVLLIVFSFFTFNAALKTINIFSRIYNYFPDLINRRKKRRARENTIKGMVEIKEGKWELAEKHLSKAARDSMSPMLNYLSAAKSAQNLGDIKKRDEYIEMAYKFSNQDDLAVRFTQVNLYLEGNELELALANLEYILSYDKNNKYAIKLLHDVYLKIGDWRSLLELIPKISQTHLFDNEKIYKIELFTNCKILDDLLENGLLDEYDAEYLKLPRRLKMHEDIIALHAKYYVKKDDPESAEKIIIKKLRRVWSENLIDIYGMIRSLNPNKQLDTAESFLRKHPNSAKLQTALARICYHNKLWSKSKSYYEESLHINPVARTYAELGDLLNIMGEHDLSAQCYKKGLELADKLADI